MKITWTIWLVFSSFLAFADDSRQHILSDKVDSLTIQVEDGTVFYQKVVKVDSSVTENLIYLRILQFMASKNFQLNYGSQEDGKMIYVSTQDLNNNVNPIGDDDEEVNPYTIQFSIDFDLKNSRYRYTVKNMIIFRPTENGFNRRIPMYDIYLKATTRESRRVAKDARSLILSFERYLDSLTGELYLSVSKKRNLSKPDF